MASKEKLEAFLAEPRNIIVAGIRKDGRPHVTPNWFHWDGERFNISTTRPRAKYSIFKRDPRAELVIDDSTHFRCVMVSGRAEIREDVEAVLPQFRAIREKHGIKVPADEEHLASLHADERVLLVITPDEPVTEWIAWGFD
jgi:PPOX class probable F420-dependent enzyme